MTTRILPCAVAFLAAGLASSQAALLFGLTNTNALVSFDSDTPGSVNNLGTISQAGIVDIDFSPTNGALYGITASGTMYFINQTNGQATLAVTPTTSISGITDMDFNPGADRVRLFGSGDMNYRLVPDASAISLPQTGTPGAVIGDGMFSNTTYDLVGSAYNNNFDGVPTSTLYSLDTVTDSLIIHTVGPAFSTVGSVGPLGFNIGSNVGFDIGQNGIAYVNDGNAFYTANLGSGALTSAGSIGFNAGTITSIAAQVPEPGVTALAAGAAVLTLRRRRNGSPA